LEKPTQEDLLATIEKEPLLTDYGMAVWHRTPPADRAAMIERDRQDLKDRLRQFRLCCEWLSICNRRKTINYGIGSSWGLKHRVERYYKEYITNGAFIAAVIHMGIPYKKDGSDVYVALSSRHLPGGEE